MKLLTKKATAAVLIATVALAALTALTACEGRRMSNMTPSGDTVEVNLPEPDSQIHPDSI